MSFCFFVFLYPVDDLEKDGVAPEVVPKAGELVDPPLGERPGGQLVLSLGPAALGLEDRVHCR